jgi:mannosyltransferase
MRAMSLSQQEPLGAVSGSSLPLGRSHATSEAWIVPAALALLTVIALAIRFVTLGTQSYWADEALTVYEMHLHLPTMLKTVANVETTPPLYFVLAWLWTHVFGTSEVGLRSLSALIGTATVPIAYAAARPFVSRRVALVPAALVVVNPFLIWYSQEARSYALLCMLAGLSFACFAALLRSFDRRMLRWWTLASAAALATHFFAVFVVAPEAVWLLFVHRRRAMRVAAAVLLFVEAAIVPFALIDLGHGVGWIATQALYKRVSWVPTGFAVGPLWRWTGVVEGIVGGGLFLAALLVVAGWGGVDLRRRLRAPFVISSAAILLPLLAAWLATDVFIARNVIGAWIPLSVLVAIACTGRTRMIGATLASALAALALVGDIQVARHPSSPVGGGQNGLQRPDWRALANALGGPRRVREILVPGGSNAYPLKIYMPGVSWIQHPSLPATVEEIVVVGPHPAARARTSGTGSPRLVAPPGFVRLSSLRVGYAVVVRYLSLRPYHVTARRLAHEARLFYRRVPKSLLVLLQRPPSGR